MPFLALRSYLPSDHPQKDRELGSEPTPGAFIDALLDVVEECRRVLAPHGSLCSELGDTYAGSGGAGGDYGENGLREGQPAFEGSGRRGAPSKSPDGATGHYNGRQLRPFGPNAGAGWPPPKSLTLVPELFRIALAYGVNPLTGRTTEPWRIRNVIRWVRPNPPVGALGDKFRPATSEMVVACTSRTRYFDLDSVRGQHSDSPGNHYGHGRAPSGRLGPDGEAGDQVGGIHPAGAPPLDWWAIPTEPYPGSHYATWPRSLCVKPILAMCPPRVCRVCGEPSRRITEPSEEYAAAIAQAVNGGEGRRTVGQGARPMGGTWPKGGDRADRRTLGWTDCGHNDWRPGACLDPFAGSGTTLAVATGHGRDAIGIDLDERNADLAMQRVGLFLTVEYFNSEPVA